MAKKVKVKSEKETKQIILELARKQGVEDKVKTLIQIGENGVKGAKTEAERQYISHQTFMHIHQTIGCVGNLVVDGKELLPATTAYQDAIEAKKSVSKLD